MKETDKPNDRTAALLNRARRYCALSEQCESGVRQKLISWGAASSEVDAVVASLRSDSYLDDMRFARAYCESKLLHQQWGRQKVVYQLRIKRIPREVIDAAMATVGDELYYDALRRAAEHKLRESGHDGGLDDLSRELRLRLLTFLASRGYTFAEINQVITNINEQ